MPYDSREGRAIAGAISALMTGVSYATSAEMAGELGAFPEYAANKDAMLRVVRNHRRAAHGEAAGYEKLATRPWRWTSRPSRDSDLAEAAKRAWDDALKLGKEHGFRNAQATVIAPTGTIGLVMDCDTTGVEPDFALVKFKTLAGGGYFKIINRCVPEALANLGYGQQEIDAIVAYAVGHGTLEDYHRPHQLRRPARQGLRRGTDRPDRGGAGIGLRHPLRLQQIHAGHEVLHPGAEAGRRPRWMRPTSTC